MRRTIKFWKDGDLLDRAAVLCTVLGPLLVIGAVKLSSHLWAVPVALIVAVAAVWSIRENRRVKKVCARLERFQDVDTLSKLSPAEQEEWKIEVAKRVLGVKQQ